MNKKHELFEILKEVKMGNKMAAEAYDEILLLFDVVGQSEQLPTLIEIDFDGHLKCQLETTDTKPKILKAVNGYGQPVDCRQGKIRINEV